jgi:hypothetical protein
MLEEEKPVRVHIPAMVGDYTLIEKPVTVVCPGDVVMSGTDSRGADDESWDLA